jgi:hypothetical protein
MGHASPSRIADVYTSFDAFQDDMRQMMEDNHYMIRDNVV